MSISICWNLNCDGLVFRPGGVQDSHLLNTTETGDKHQLHGPPVARKGFSLSLFKVTYSVFTLNSLYHMFKHTAIDHSKCL